MAQKKGHPAAWGVSDKRDVAALFRLCPLHWHTVPLGQILPTPCAGGSSLPGLPITISFAEEPQTWGRIFDKTVWIFPAAFSQGRSSYLPWSRRRMGTLWVWVGSAPRGTAAFMFQVCIPLSRLDLTPRLDELRALLQAFLFNCLDIRVITQLSQIKAAYLPEHNREEMRSFFTSQWSINARNR